MAGADYAHCDGEPCLMPSSKVFYDADTDVPTGTVILHAECDEARQAAAERRGQRQMIAALRDTDRFVQWGFKTRPETGVISDVCADYLDHVAGSKEKGEGK